LSDLDFIEMENHSYSHARLKGLSSSAVREDILKNAALLEKITRRRTLFFRFPYGDHDSSALQAANELGYPVVHWTFPSGDPDKNLTKEALLKGVISKVKPGAILIFHINQRGWKTGEALPGIVATLKSMGYEFILLKDAVKR